MVKAEKKNKIKWILTIVSFVLSLATIIGVLFAFGNMAETKTMSSTAYHIGTIDDGGKIVDSRKSIYSDMKTTESLEITLDEDSQITYKVVFYDENEDFISMSETLETDFDTTATPENAEYFRVVITPNQIDGEDTIVNIFNMGKYTKMLNVTFANK